MKNKKIQLIRKKLDKLDLQMLTIIKSRSLLVKRIKIILQRIKKESKKRKIDPAITNTIWKSMIRSFINYEFRNFKKK